MAIEKLFPTLLYQAKAAGKPFLKQLLLEVDDIAGLDVAGHAWSEENYRNGFTSYASVNNLHRTSPTFARLEAIAGTHAKKFARALDLDLQGGRLAMTNCWVNIMPPNAHHGLHLHPLSVISGTFYLQVPKGASAIKFEDPRLSSFMGAPPRKVNARRSNQTFISIAPAPGQIVLFESWLRHEVPLNSTSEPRISVSFNFGWE